MLLQISQMGTFFLAGGLIAIFLVAVTIIAVTLYQRRLLGQERKMQEIQAEHQRRLLQASIKSQESERARIARNLHDEVGALLATAKLQINHLGTFHSDPEVKEESKAITQLLSEGLQTVRSISHDLLPPTLQHMGLIESSKAMLSKIPNIKSQIVIKGPPTKLTQDIDLGLYRVINELINNTIKYAEAKTITLTYHFLEEEIRLRYEDDGKGFDMEKLPKDRGLGLHNMESRIQVMGGIIQITSSPGNGTTTEIGIPLTEIHSQQMSSST